MTEFSTGFNNQISKISIDNEQEVTLKFVHNKAKEIWAKASAEIKRRNLALGDIDTAEELMTEIRREYKEFAMSYPIVLRYMCEMQQFSSKAFWQYLEYIDKNPWKSEEEYIEAQVTYVSLLYKNTHSHARTHDINILRINIRKMLTDEHKRFKELHDKFKKEVEEKQGEYKAANKATLAQYFRMVHDTNNTGKT